MECVAYNGPGGKGVFAVARCCVVGGLQCQIHTSAKPGQDAECVGRQHHLTGCTSWSKAEILPGSRPHHGDRKRCVVKDGVTSDAVCCHAPSLECHVLENTSADKDEVNILKSLTNLRLRLRPFDLTAAALLQVEVSCPSGWTLTDCSAASQSSAVLGAVV
ncbi:Proprotein convertase subtilisin/kexin type 9, partial [Nibea albiflora]